MEAQKQFGNRKVTADPVIQIHHLFKKFGDHIVLSDFDLKLKKEENLVVLGKSGSGKSVLVKCIVGLIKPDRGKIQVLGEDIFRLEEDELNKLRTKLGFLFQSNALYDSMTIRENLRFPLLKHRFPMSEAEIEARIIEVLEHVGLKHTIDMMPAELSGGMAKRIALARAMVLRPEVIFYDEPTSGLDPVTSREIATLILEMKEKYHISAIIISHDMACVKITADRIVLLLEGRCYAQGTYEELKHSKDRNITQFFN
ncbi:ABC transporter ATP-binding protein [Pedobacter gandavensis]|uniref:ATP-binding cassette domain-containing protein n=1 Tax=Pedobacter gandavensis TaxID=2679963 RepID=A0ABR6EQK2_9SPHI|nr:ATP-binding cassette domain-containing protein [Pedobacter gandavensis]MBB2147530.1 ATP-binding cassette domain-containing protein [Pedobacter gandavensis]